MQRKPCNFSEDRMRMAVLGGFLGSGKTTWLRHQLHEGVFNGAFVIVNDAVETPVDDALLQGSSGLRFWQGAAHVVWGRPISLHFCARFVMNEASRRKIDSNASF